VPQAIGLRGQRGDRVVTGPQGLHQLARARPPRPARPRPARRAGQPGPLDLTSAVRLGRLGAPGWLGLLAVGHQAAAGSSAISTSSAARLDRLGQPGSLRPARPRLDHPSAGQLDQLAGPLGSIASTAPGGARPRPAGVTPGVPNDH